MSDTSPLWNFLLRARRRRRTPEDSDWVEVHDINSHAVFMGYLAMTVRGLSILLVTWSTVVLLGGFFSELGKKDFWCISGITFVQAAGSVNSLFLQILILYFLFLQRGVPARLEGTTFKFCSLCNPNFTSELDEGWVFDGPRSRRLSNIMVSFKGLLSTVATLTRPMRHNKLMDKRPKGCARVYFLLVVAIMYTQQAMLAVTMFPIVAVYVSGPYIPIWLATWRLRQRDYASKSGDDKQSNLRLALDILYVLTVTQGAMFYYMTLCSLAGMCLVSKVLGLYKFDKWGRTSVLGYLLETNTGCRGQPSFAGGRNLITYAVDQINSDSAGRITSGVEILGTLLKLQQSRHHSKEKWRYLLIGQHMLIKQLVGPVSSGEVMRKLLQMLDSRSPYHREVRRHAARIVAHLADDIYLEQFPRGIQCVASLLDTFEEYRLLEPYQRDWLLNTYEKDWYRGVACLPELKDDVEEEPDGYKDLVLQALCILRKLAFVPDNFKVICNAKGLLPKIMAPVIRDILHTIDHKDSWFSEVVEGSLKVMCQLLDMSPPGEAERNLRLEVPNNKNALITAAERILKCKICSDSVREQSVELLTRLHIDASWGMGTQKRQEFTKMMLDEFCKHCPLDSETDVTADEAPEKGILHFLQSHTSISYKYKLPDDTQEKAGRKVDIRNAAAGALMRLSSQDKSIAAIILKAKDNIVNDLIALLLSVKDKVYRRAAAAIILERLCIDYTTDDAYLKKLKEALTAALPKLLQQIVYYYATPKEIQKNTEDGQVGSREEEIDEENQSGDSKSNGHIKGPHMDVGKEKETHSDRGHIKDDGSFRRHFIPASLSLCVTVCNTCIRADRNRELPRLLKDVVDKINSTTENNHDTAKNSRPLFFRVTKNRLPTADKKNSHPTADDLRTLKLISRLIISIMKHQGRYDNEDLDKLMQALDKASDCYAKSILEASMVFTSSDDGACTVMDSMFNRSTDLAMRSLKSLVEEAQVLVNKKKVNSSK
ncbi:hypothetical protein EJB05_01335, partial [Eragrostis curvula]